VAPSIAVYAEPFEYEPGESLIGFLPGIEAMYQNVLREYRQVGKPVESLISNCESVEYFSEFLFDQPNTCLMARNRSLITIREPQIYTVNMFDYPAHGMEAQNEFNSFVSSVAYV